MSQNHRQSDNLYRTLVEHSPQGLVIIQDGRIVYANPAVTRIVGYSVEELMAFTRHQLPALLHPQDRELVRRWLEEDLAQKSPSSAHEYRVLTKDGTLGWVELYASAITYREKPAIQITCRDISDRIEMEEALRRSEKRFRSITQTASDAIIIFNSSESIFFWNRAAKITFGYLPGETVGKRLATIMPEPFRQSLRSEMKRLASSDQSSLIGKTIEMTGIRKDGSEFPVEISLSIWKAADEDFFTVVARDITERKQAEEAQRLRWEQLNALSKASQAVTISLDLDHVLTEIVTLTRQVTGADHTSVVLVSDQGTMDRCTEGPSEIPALEWRARDNGLTNWMIETGRHVIVDDIDQDGELHPYPGDGAPRCANPVLIEAGIRSLTGLPLSCKGQLLGLLFLYSMKPGAFHDQLPLLTTFANQVAIAIEHARLFQAEQRQSRRLAVLADVARIAATTMDADNLLQAVADTIHDHFDYPMIELLTLEPDAKTLLLRGYRGIPVAEPVDITPGTYRHPIDLGIIGQVACTKQPYYAPHVSQDPHYYQASDLPSIKSELCIPILENDTLVGVIDVESNQPADFDDWDQSLLEAVADTVGSGLRKLRLYEEARKRVQELTLLNNISAGFGAALDLDALISNALQGLQELIGADRTYFVTIDLEARGWEITHEQIAPGITSDLGSSGSFGSILGIIETLSAGQPFAVFDVATDPRVEAARDRYQALGIQSFLLMPVHVGKELMGVLGFDQCRQRRAWRPADIRLLEGVAHQLELALDNVHLFEEARMHAEELTKTLNRLEELDRLKDEFIQNVSHELRSPLALIRSYAEMLSSGELGSLQPEQVKPVEVITRRTRMLGELVDDITLILAAEVSPPPPVPVALDRLVETVAEDFHVAVEQAQLTLITDVPPDVPPVRGSTPYLGRVIDNLLSNAIKFTPEGGTITLRLRQEDGQVVLEVKDTGIGIPEDQIECIFERFYQVDGSSRRRYRGMGLGLALVKEIVEAYGGQVAVKSQVDQGSSFFVRLPVVPGQQST